MRFSESRNSFFLLPLWEKVVRTKSAPEGVSIRGEGPLTRLRFAQAPSPTSGEGKKRQNKGPGREGRGLEFVRPCKSGQSRWPSSCSSSVTRLLKFKYSDSAPVIADRSAMSPPCEA